MKTKIITIIGLLYITIMQPLTAQDMGKQIAQLLSKKVVKELIASGKAIYDSVKSHNEFSDVYRLSEGQLLYVRENGTGALWESQEQIDSLMNESKAEISVLNLEDWLNKDSDIEALITEANKLLSGVLGKEIDYSEKSLKAVGKIKIKNVVAQKDTFYTILLYACGYYAHHYGGMLEIVMRDNEVYMPYVIGEKGRSFAPYVEYMKGISDPPRISLEESINLERIKYNLRKD